MPNEALVAAVKNIIGLAKAQKMDEAYAAYAELFTGALFPTLIPSEQRQALKLMILAKGIPTFPNPSIVKAHRAAMVPLRALVAEHDDAQDYELLGLCQVRTDDEAGARASFQKGLDLERARDPQSPPMGTQEVGRVGLIALAGELRGSGRNPRQGRMTTKPTATSERSASEEMKNFLRRHHPPRPTFASDMSAEEADVMRAHAMYWHGLLEQGAAVVFGPVADPKGAWGLGVVRVASEEALAALCEADPAIKAGRGLRYEVLPMLRAVTRP